MSKASAPFKYRGKWRAQVTLKNGSRPCQDFVLHADAKQWIYDMKSKSDTEHDAVLGGPSGATLAQALDHYGRNYSVDKGGVVAELNRINRYLLGVGMPLLKAVENDKGAVEVQEYPATDIPKSWKSFNDKRRALRKGTYLQFAQLAAKRCNTISTTDIRALFVQMNKDALSDSTVQKEIAMLKTMFNTAIKEWQWKGYENPCLSIRLGKSQRRFVHLTKQQRDDLNAALGECDNPYIWPLALVAKETTLRRDTLLSMQWSLVDLENRTMMLPTKTGQKSYSISKPVLEVLSNLPHDPSGFVFPLTPNAVTLAWNRVRTRANLPGLQFKDLRHLGATDWVRRGLQTHELKHVLGHSTIGTAQFYVDLVAEDQLHALDMATERGGVVELPPSSPKDAQTQRNGKRALRLNRAKTGEGDSVSNERNTTLQNAAQAVDAPPVQEAKACTPANLPVVESVVKDATSVLLRTHGKVTAMDAEIPERGSSNVIQFRFKKKAA